MITKGKHSRLDLAQRHARNLEREHGLEREQVIILSRRNDSGRFSVRGRNFFFKVPEKRPVVPPKPPIPPKKKEIGSLKEFLELLDDDAEYRDYEGGTDYGEE